MKPYHPASEMGGASSHQTVRIARGRHKRPSEGACVMELASMLAGERFSDRPQCVDPAIAAYLRAFNDRLGHAHRQRLFPYAARVVGSRSSPTLARRRRDLCLAFAGHPVPRHMRWAFRLAMRLRLAVVAGLGSALFAGNGIPTYAARMLVARGDIERGFALVDAMLAIREDGSAPAPHTAGPELLLEPREQPPAREPVGALPRG